MVEYSLLNPYLNNIVISDLKNYLKIFLIEL